MSKKVVLVGHCGADSTYLKLAVKAADPDGRIVSAESEQELKAELVSGADLVLVNRVVDYGYETDEGVEIVRAFSKAFPSAKLMLVSNHASAQDAAVAAGGMPGFGKREIGSPKVKEMLKKALGATVPVT